MSESTEAGGDAIRALVGDAVARAAPEMAAESVARLATLVEADLKTEFRQALRDAAAESGAEAEVAAIEQSVRFAEWPGVGGVDVALILPGAGPKTVVFFELKWGAGTLYSCIWDAPKMALADALGACELAYLVAGAPAPEWSAADGADLFADGTWSSDELFARHRKHWEKWRRDVKTRPLRVPASFNTRVVASSTLSIGGAPWELRAAQVSPSAGWFDVVRTSSGRGDRRA